MTINKFNLSVDEAVAVLKEEAERLGASSGELKDIDPDTAFTLGYSTAIYDFERVTGNDPMEATAVSIETMFEEKYGPIDPDEAEAAARTELDDLAQAKFNDIKAAQKEKNK